MEPTGFKSALFGFKKADVLEFIADANREYQQQLEEQQQQTEAVHQQLVKAQQELEAVRQQLVRQQQRADKMDGLSRISPQGLLLCQLLHAVFPAAVDTTGDGGLDPVGVVHF